MLKPPPIDRVDHVHVYVTDRQAAEQWYQAVLGFERKKELEKWAVPHGPLMLQDASGSVVIAVFEKPPQANLSVIALGVTGVAFVKWLSHLSQVLQQDISPVDHGLAWSIYFSDPDSNPYEITTYDYDEVAGELSGS